MTRVLVIDDCDEFREVVSDLLIDAGYQVLSADGPEQARTFLDRKNFDLVICDLCMPVERQQSEEENFDSAMVGVHTVSEFSKLAPKVPIIAVSGQLTGEPLQAIQNFGAVVTLSKPFGQAELLTAVKQALKAGDETCDSAE